jgi:hypothetical protein
MEKITELLKANCDIQDGTNEYNDYWLIQNHVCNEIIYNRTNYYFSFIISYNENCPTYYKFMYNECLQRAKNLQKQGKLVFISYEINNSFKIETNNIYDVVYILSSYSTNELNKEFNISSNLFKLGITNDKNLLIKEFYEENIENNMSYFSKKNKYIELFEQSDNRDLFKIRFIKSDNEYKYYIIEDVISNNLTKLEKENEIKIPVDNILTPHIFYDNKSIISGSYVEDDTQELFYNIIY